MNQYIIMKKSRSYDNPRRIDAYANTDTCMAAEVEPGQVYLDLSDAERDAKKLGMVNPVGFDVKELIDFKMDLTTGKWPV
jgi:hypothetical protein